MDYIYLILPFIAWLFTGITKFFVNSIREKRLAVDLIGYGGMPSNHSSIVSSTAAMIAFKEGVHHPAFGVAITLCFIVMMDANGLRRKIGLHAIEINKLNEANATAQTMRERVGHTKSEICAGILCGVIIAWLTYSLFFSLESF
ncbi:divergent PAP2 family protein [Vibrio algarum]|uniref:Divergent PAP2 family protein n=1 Tax=Vibrio algarum TaxID=3020714 RepID=A0ABT4YLM3_9VIBR|nr:divergent PAP2 family protein [Vibrio sp. KJ40-1]MDB1122420.1 divergent PAP2 family protein [Vibrio sp. KJ40-1]